MRGKTRGFTLIEVIVVIAIIGILAMLLVPNMLGYVKKSKISQFNANAKTVFSGAQLAITDTYNGGGQFTPGEIFVNSADGDGQCTGQSGGEICDITDYVGENFRGYFGFVMDSSGTGASYALWSDHPLATSDFTGMLSLNDVKNHFNSNSKPMGCHPLKTDQGT